MSTEIKDLDMDPVPEPPYEEFEDEDKKFCLYKWYLLASIVVNVVGVVLAVLAVMGR
jgi:hypothetical protein